MDAYPHELSGGMCQRVIIAMAVCGHPKLIIADEPTTALDVTVQAQVLELLKDLQKKLNTAILLITHNLGVVWEMCDTVMVMYAGNTVEYADTKTLYQEPLHPYTWGLLDSMPKLSSSAKRIRRRSPEHRRIFVLPVTAATFITAVLMPRRSVKIRYRR